MQARTLSVVSSLALLAGLAAPAMAQETGPGAEPSPVPAPAPAPAPAQDEPAGPPADEPIGQATPGPAAPAPAGVETDDDGRMSTIIVTAQFREANLQDTPLAITAVNAEILEARGQTDIAQVASQAPNVTLKPQPGNGGSGLIAFIRGVGQTDFNFALDPGVGVYIDDVYIPTLSSSLLELIDLDRVEILRGPQGTLAGKNSIGGAIKLFSARPEGSGEGAFRAAYGSYNLVELRGTADFGIADNLFARVSGVGKSRDGHVSLVDYALTHPGSTVPANNARGRGTDNYATLGGVSMAAGRLALRWLPTTRLEINLSGDYTSDKSEANPLVLIAAGAPVDFAEDFDPFSVNPATDANGRAWLPGTDGNPVPVDCRFVPAGPYSCDPVNMAALGYNPRYINYMNFADTKVPTGQAPYKPYFALPIREFTGWGVHGNITYDIDDDLQLVYIGSFRKYESKWGQDQDGTPVPIAQLDNQLNHQAWSAELRLNGALFEDMLQYTLGGFYLKQDGEYNARVDLNYAGIDFVHGPDTTPSTTQALFATATLFPTDGLSLTGGIRYTKDEKIYTYYRSNPDGTQIFVDVPPSAEYPIPICEYFQGAPTAGPTGEGNTPNCLLSGLFGITDGFEGDRFDWRVAADYRFSPEVLVYASVSTGFKGGGVNPRPFFGPSAGDCNAPGYVPPAPCNQLRPFDPETIITYEAGFKTDLLDRRLRLNGAAFFNNYDDIILTLSACPSIPCLQPRNVGQADVKGVELEATAFPVDGLSLDGSVSYIDFQYKGDTVFDPNRGYESIADEFGNSIGVPIDGVTPYTPKWNWSLGLQYDYEAGFGTISGRIDGAYQSSVVTDSNNSPWSRIDGYFISNARLAYTMPADEWRVALEVANLFDKYYFLTISDVSTSLGVVTGDPGLPRTFKVSVERRF